MTETATGLLLLLALFLQPFIVLHWYGRSGEPTYVERIVHRYQRRRSTRQSKIIHQTW